MMGLEGKRALVTGASRGIGREIALACGAVGAKLALVGRSREGLEETKRLLGGHDAQVFQADLRNQRDIEDLVAELANGFGDVDILVNAAGVWHGPEGPYKGPRLPQTPVSQVNEILDVGLRASFLLSRLLLPAMMRKRMGKILQLSCGFAGPHEALGWLHYYVTNQAIEAFTKGLAAEMREYEIQVNCIAPWFVATEAVRRYYPIEAQTALHPKEVAGLARFLVSSGADHITGQVIELRSKVDH